MLPFGAVEALGVDLVEAYVHAHQAGGIGGTVFAAPFPTYVALQQEDSADFDFWETVVTIQLPPANIQLPDRGVIIPADAFNVNNPGFTLLGRDVLGHYSVAFHQSIGEAHFNPPEIPPPPVPG